MPDRIFNLLLVDDEEEIREGIANSLHWEEYNIKIIDKASNGKDALKKIFSIKTDIILLDIRMPVMDGIEVLKKLSNKKEKPKIIILSGYDDFTYCQFAIKYGASAYLLKPCHPKEIIETINKIKGEILKEEKNTIETINNNENFWSGLSNITSSNFLDIEKSNLIKCIDKYKENILSCVKKNNKEKLLDAINLYYSNIANASQRSKKYADKIVSDLLFAVYHLCIERSLDIEKYFGPQLSSIDEILSIETINEQKENLYYFLESIIEDAPLNDIAQKKVEKALCFMEEHYMSELNLNNVAYEVAVSAGYLSFLFKKVLNKTFLHCLHEIRIYKAKSLLKEINLLIYEIAYKVGYKDEKHFSQIFKKLTGMTPSEYREMCN